MSLEAFTHYSLSICCIRETEADLIQSTRAINCESSLGCLEIVTLDQSVASIQNERVATYSSSGWRMLGAGRVSLLMAWGGRMLESGAAAEQKIY